MRHFAGMDFDLVVGDCGSTDGSIAMLERFQARGWLELRIAPNGRAHSEWLDRWLRECPTRYALFSDSDVEFNGADWLADMVDTAQRRNAALVCGRMQHGAETFVHPVTRAERRIAPRPTAWLQLIDTWQVRDRVSATFEYVEVEDFEAFGGKVAYDTGAWYFKELCEAGLNWAEMPTDWQHKYRHFGGLTWLGPTALGTRVAGAGAPGREAPARRAAPAPGPPRRLGPLTWPARRRRGRSRASSGRSHALDRLRPPPAA